MNGVFDVKPGSGYDDNVTEQYHFPKHLLNDALDCLGDWIVYREPRRNGGRTAYFGAAQVEAVKPDPANAANAYAFVREYIPFPVLVPLKRNGRYAEEFLRLLPKVADVGRSRQNKSIRTINAADFDAIVLEGLSATLAPANVQRLGLDPGVSMIELSPAAYTGFEDNTERTVTRMLVSRKLRDANFRLQVCEAYDNRCAITGLRIINGGGRPEVQAAHIKPVQDNGPDVIQNGLALSATVHWLFDRHLISIDENYRLLVSHNRVPSDLVNLFRPRDQQIHLPANRNDWPHPAFLTHHRERFAGHA